MEQLSYLGDFWALHFGKAIYLGLSQPQNCSFKSAKLMNLMTIRWTATAKFHTTKKTDPLKKVPPHPNLQLS